MMEGILKIIDETTVVLRPLCLDDSAQIIKWRNSDAVTSNFVYRKKFTIESQDDWYHNFVKTGKVIQFIISDVENNIDVGSVYLRDIDEDNKKCEFGIFIVEEEYKGKGI